MKLYYSPGACSLAPHIALAEAGLTYTTEKVDLGKHVVADGRDFYSVNPKGYVPALDIGNGALLTEAAVILQYIADRVPGTLAPAHGTLDYYRVAEWLNFVATELHQKYGPFWYPTTPEATKEANRAKLAKRFDVLAKTLTAHPYLTGDKFTVADAYLFTILNWSSMVKIDLTPWPALQAFQARVAARPGVQRALREEGLLPQAAAA
ncbi:MAG: glutathione transferase GstA [Burkholderiales bacterium]